MGRQLTLHHSLEIETWQVCITKMKPLQLGSLSNRIWLYNEVY